MDQTVPRVNTSREELHQIYESADVEVRPFVSHESSSSDHDWREASTVVMERGLGGVVITGWNPGQLRPTAAENERANQRMLTVLEQTGHEIWHADGFSPDRTFREPGFIAWGMDPDQGCAIARDFGQFAIFYYDSDGNRSVISSGLA